MSSQPSVTASQHDTITAVLERARRALWPDPPDVVADTVLDGLRASGYVLVHAEEIRDALGDHCPAHAEPSLPGCPVCYLLHLASAEPMPTPSGDNLTHHSVGGVCAYCGQGGADTQQTCPERALAVAYPAKRPT